MKILDYIIGFCFAIVFISPLSAVSDGVIINEIELNPSGGDSGNEWIEFYCDKETDLNEWKIVNNDGDELILNFSFLDYYVFEFDSQWLDNSDEKITLFDSNGNQVFDTEILSDSMNNDKTLQYCDKEYVFLKQTKEDENNCKNEELVDNAKDEEEEDETEVDQKEEKEEYLKRDKSLEVIKENKEEYETILDTSKNIIKLGNILEDKETENRIIYKSKNEYIKEGAVYGFTFLCIIIIVLLIKDR